MTTKWTSTEVRAFVGKNADYYCSRWTPLLGGQDWSGFNWAACLLSAFWLPYRKMYGAALAYYSVLSLLAVAEEAAAGGPDTSAVWSLVRFTMAIVFGACANKWYFDHFSRKAAQVRAAGVTDEAELARVLSKQGGTSLAAALVSFGLFLAVTLVMLCALHGFP